MLVTQEQLEEWLRIDPNSDPATIQMLAESGADVVEHLTGRQLRPFVDLITGETVTPTIPAALQHAIAIHVAAHFDDRSGDTNAAMATIVRLCAPYRVFSL